MALDALSSRYSRLEFQFWFLGWTRCRSCLTGCPYIISIAQDSSNVMLFNKWLLVGNGTRSLTIFIACLILQLFILLVFLIYITPCFCFIFNLSWTVQDFIWSWRALPYSASGCFVFYLLILRLMDFISIHFIISRIEIKHNNYIQNLYIKYI